MAARTPLDHLRAICLAFPETAEKPQWDTETFRVRDKIFVIHTTNDGTPAIWCKAPPGAQDVLVGGDPERFFVPPYVGPRGWIGVRLGGKPNWGLVTDLIEDSYRLVAPKRLVKQMDGAKRRGK